MSKPILERNIKIPDEILSELLTPSELRMIKNRWRIIQLLGSGLSIRQTAKEAKTGTDTVVRVARLKKNIGNKKLNEDILSKKKVNSTWIFGQSS